MMTETKPQGPAELASLVERAESTDPDWALTDESPLSLEVSGKYVNVLFSTGGPHTEILVEYEDAEAAEYWFENEPRVAIFTFMDWGTREDVTVSKWDAEKIMSAIVRDADELSGGHVNYPHEPGYLCDCPACEAECHCTPGSAECVWSGHEDES